jgi:hypothetical protein
VDVVVQMSRTFERSFGGRERAGKVGERGV